MDFASTIETVAGHLPEELTDVIRGAASLVPADFDLVHIAKFLLFFSLGSLILSVLGRFILGRRSSLNHSLSSVMAILFVYAVTIMVYTFQPWSLEQFLSPLPFVTFFNDYLVVMPVVGIYPTVLARELLSLIILAFLVNLLDTLIPQGKSIPGWYCLRFFTVALSMVLYLLIHWAFHTYAPEILVEYAPMVLLLLLVSLLVLGFLNAVLGLILTITNPFVGAVYTFFFSNIVGKQVTKAVFTTAILCVILFLMGQYGYSFIHISTSALTAYVPVAAVCLVLWYLIGHVL
ncbi:MAG: hypothetical protein IJE81_02990 [Oscillospiraceae bacterium]|nr:hypothetical protein [Oscillospiraceae bacterium]MBQ7129847.1 hypothetical protein [Oscillospiraceae bacterium]